MPQEHVGIISVHRIVFDMPRLLCFTAFLTSLPIYSPNIVAINANGNVSYLTGLYAEPLLLITFIVALILAAISYFHKEAIPQKTVVTCVLMACYVLGCLGYASMLMFDPSWAGTFVTVFAVITAIGILPTCVMWTCAFAHDELLSLIGNLIVSSLFCIAIHAVLGAMPYPAYLVLYIALVLAGAIWPFIVCFGLNGNKIGQNQIEAEVTEDSTKETKQISEKVNIHSFLSVMGVPLLGMLIASFATGVSPVSVFDNTVPVSSIAMGVSACALIPLFVFRDKKPFFSFIYQLYLPIAAFIVLIGCLSQFQWENTDFVLIIQYSFYSMITVLAIASACAIANAHEFPRVFIFALMISAFCGMSILGIFIGRDIQEQSTEFNSLFTVFTGIYCSALLLEHCYKSWQFTVQTNDSTLEIKPSPMEADVALPDQEKTFDMLLEQYAKEYGLSPREKEIASYVGRGHSSVFVAKTLLISESTVYTHVRNIYRKMGISSREELIQLFNGTPRQTETPAH